MGGAGCCCTLALQQDLNNYNCCVAEILPLKLRPLCGVLKPEGIFVSMATDCFAHAQVYWTEASPPCIKRANLNGSSGVEVFINFSIARPEGLAIDPYSGNLYWTDFRLGTYVTPYLIEPEAPSARPLPLADMLGCKH